MNRIFKTTILSAAVAAMTLAALPAANARDWHRHGRHSNGDAIAAGVLGLAAGALIGGALSNSRSDYYDGYAGDYIEPGGYYVQPAPVRRYYPARVEARGSYGLRPWSRAWYQYCSDRYRTFDARTGTFVGYDGQEHFCAAN